MRNIQRVAKRVDEPLFNKICQLRRKMSGERQVAGDNRPRGLPLHLGHFIVLATLPNPEKILAFAESAAENNWTANQLYVAVQKEFRQNPEGGTKNRREGIDKDGAKKGGKQSRTHGRPLKEGAGIADILTRLEADVQVWVGRLRRMVERYGDEKKHIPKQALKQDDVPMKLMEVRKNIRSLLKMLDTCRVKK